VVGEPTHARLRTLRTLTHELARPLDALELFRSVYRATARILDAQVFLLGLYDEGSQTVEVIRQVEDGAELPGGSFPLGDGLTSQVIHTREARLIRNWSADGPPVHVRYASNKAGLPESAIIVPLLHSQHVLGVLAVYSYHAEAFDADDLLLMEVIAGHAAAAIANLSHSDRLDAQLQRRVSELEVILASMGDALLIVDMDGRVVRVNHAARVLLGIEESSVVLGQVLDREHWPQWPTGAQQVATKLGPFIEALKRGETPAEQEIELSDPARRILSLSGTPLHDVRGALSGSVLIVRDVTGPREIEDLKDEMLAIASHDLRTPITVIKAQAQTLRRIIDRASASVADVATGLDSIVVQSDHLTRLLTLLLDLSRIEAGRFELTRQPMDLRELVARTIVGMQATTARHSLRMRASRPVFGDWDARRIQEVLENLLTNAVKYSPGGGLIEVGLRTGPRAVTVRVTDSGVGLDPKEAPHVFERFYRGQRIRQLEGAGLGLYICQVIVAAHGGRIWAESAGPGTGTSFCFTLPRAAGEAQSQGMSLVE
jgi:PAS domain S-box-containing protein